MQVQVRVPLHTFTCALGLAQRDSLAVGMMLSPADEAVLTIAKAFHARYPNHCAEGRHPAGRKGREDAFYRDHCHLYLCKDGVTVRGGYAVLEGALMSMWNLDKGHGDWMMRHAIDLGAVHVNFYDVPYLRGFYEKHGFKINRVDRPHEGSNLRVCYADRVPV